MRTPTSPKKLHIKLRPNFMSTRETARRAPTKRSYDYYHHFGIFAKCYQGIFAFGRTASSPTSHEFAYIDIFNNKATTYKRGRHFHHRNPLKEDGRAWEIPFGHGDELRGATSYGPPTTRRRQDNRARAIPFDHGGEHEPLQRHEDGTPMGLLLRVQL